MKKLYLILFLPLLFSLFFKSALVLAQAPTTILPEARTDCPDYSKFKDNPGGYAVELEKIKQKDPGDDLGCKIKTGTIQLVDIPFVIRELSEFLIGLAGILCMFFIVYGGYQYVYGALGENKDKGKTTIFYACLGLVLVSLSWIIVNIVIFAVTQ